MSGGTATGYFGAGGKGMFYRNAYGVKPINTNLTNTTGRAMAVWATSSANRHPSFVWIYVNDIVASFNGGDHDEGWATSGTFAIVPPGATYRVYGDNNGVPNQISQWVELSL